MLDGARKQQVANTLRINSLFSNFSEQTLPDVLSELEFMTISGGVTLFRQGDPGDALYLVISGRLSVTIEQKAGEVVVAELGPGETVGEMALLDGEPRTATVHATRATRLAKLSRPGFERLLTRYPRETLSCFTRDLTARMRALNLSAAAKGTTTRTICAIGCGPGVPLTDFCERLSTALGRFGPALHLSSGTLSRHLGTNESGNLPVLEQGGLVEWLADQELTQRHILYEADPTLTPWTELAVRQADHLLFVASAAAGPVLTELEHAIQRTLPGRKTSASLVLLHSDPAHRPRETYEWLRRRNLVHHHHVRTYSDTDISRLARNLAGRAVGLVLGGGFARGLAHIGVIRAVRELGIPVDFVGGTSMGAIIAAQCACDFPDDRIAALTLRGAREAMSGDYTLPILSLFTGRKLANVICEVAEQVGVQEIHDTWLPFFCISSNLSLAEMKVHSEGPIVKSILASARFPGLFPPVTWDKDLLVDGGLVNNVPADVMRQQVNGGIVIASDVTPKVDFQAGMDLGFDVSGWRLLWRRLRHDAGPTSPSIQDVLARTIDFAGASRKRRVAEAADLYLNPPLGQFRAIDFGNAQAIIDTGYRYAREQLTEWIEREGRPWELSLAGDSVKAAEAES